MNVWTHANPQLRDLVSYKPGKPIEELARERGLDPSRIIKLASNENPLGPSPKAVEAMTRALRQAHLYPDGGGYRLREAVAAGLGVTIDHVILGNGSNEIIEFIGHAFLKPGDNIVTARHAFVVYKLMATLFGAETIEAPDPGFVHDLDATLAAVNPRTKEVFIANPNNPTGTMVGMDALRRFMDRVPEHVVTVIDEAYREFVTGPPDTLEFVREGRNVVLLRTFSKIMGLAGLRIGYGIGPAPLIEVLQKTRQPFNANAIAQAGAIAGLGDTEHRRRTKEVTDEGRAYLQGEFGKMNLEFVPSSANFVLVKVGDGNAVYQKMLDKGVIIRAMAEYKLPEWVRISVGTMEQNRRCVETLREVLR